MIAFAPASIVFIMLSSVLPPDAIIGISGKSFLMFATISGVSCAHATLRIVAPLSIRDKISVSFLVTVIITGISTAIATADRFRFEIGEFRTTPIAPCDSTSFAIATVRSPLLRLFRKIPVCKTP